MEDALLLLLVVTDWEDVSSSLSKSQDSDEGLASDQDPVESVDSDSDMESDCETSI